MLDKDDIVILNELIKNAREKTTNIAAKLKKRRTTVHDRIQKLFEKGIIKKFTVQIDHRKIGKSTTVFVLVSVTPTNVDHIKLSKTIANLPGVCEVHMVSGQYDILVKIRGKTIEDIGNMIINKLRRVSGVSQTFTLACFETIKEEINVL